MIISKKFYEYNMRDDFSVPVYVGYDLIEIGKIKGINPQKRIAGQLIRENGQTYLELADFPSKKNMSSNPSRITYDFDDKVKNQDDGSTWYASTWDGKMQFVIRKYFRVDFTTNIANNHFSGSTSKWLVSDYSIANQLMLSEKIESADLSLDHVYTWFNIFHPDQDWSKTQSLILKDLSLKKHPFLLEIGARGTKKHELHIFQKTAYMSIKIVFESPQTRDFSYQLAVIIRNFFQILIGKSIGINRIILNRNILLDTSNQNITRDERENWFLDQSFLPNEVNETRTGFATSYDDISDEFNSILKEYLNDLKMQRFVADFLIVDHFRTPVNTQIITLVSAVESYYNEAKYINGKNIQKAIYKLERLSKLVEKPNDFLKNGIHGNATDVNSLLQEMVDARDYIVHGVKSEKYTSEAELVPDLIIFKNIIREAIVRIISKQVKSNNE